MISSRKYIYSIGTMRMGLCSDIFCESGEDVYNKRKGNELYKVYKLNEEELENIAGGVKGSLVLPQDDEGDMRDAIVRVVRNDLNAVRMKRNIKKVGIAVAGAGIAAGASYGIYKGVKAKMKS
jgi:hypothetical protein